MKRLKFVKKSDIEKLPKTAGVYCFADIGTSDVPIYIGKAANIKNRVKNHFQQPSYRDNLFVNKVNKIGYLKTNSEIEALILEANLIKKHQPKFNVMWRDDKNYFYVAIEKNKQKIPYVYITHQPKIKADRVPISIQVGPFTEGIALKKTLRFLRKVFPYYTAKKHPKVKCTYCHLDLCPGPYPDLPEYKKNIKKLILILKGKKIRVLSQLKKEMQQASKLQNFEKAAKLRDRIYNLQNIMSHTHVINNETNLSTLSTGVRKNHAIAYFLRTPTFRINRTECYDISNIQGKQATGSMVVFVNGKPDKNQYRKFKIRLAACLPAGREKPNDIAMLKEVLKRRFSHPEWPYPDAILVDGGKAQLNAALEIKKLKNYFKNYKIKNIKILAIAKGRQELYIEGQAKPIPLKQLPQDAYNLIKHLDDEAHRFALSYHKTLRKKHLLK